MFTLRRQKFYSKGSPDHTQAMKVKTVCDLFNSEFTQQDAKRVTVKNVTGLLLACFVGNSLNINVFFCSSTKRSV